MAGSTDNANSRPLLWVSASNGAANQDQVRAAGEPFHFDIQFCLDSEVATSLPSQRWVALVVEIGAGRVPEGIARIRQMREQQPHVPVVAASADASLDTMRSALTAGAADFLSLPLVPTEVHKAFLRLSHSRPQASGSNQPGDVITVFGARGGLGATTLAVNLAVRATTLSSESVGLVDLDLQRGDVAAFLNLTPRQSLSAMAQTYSEIDEVFLEGILTRHSSGVAVLPAPNDIEDADGIGREQVESGLTLMRAAHRFVFIDTPRTLTDITLAAFEQATHVLLLTDLSIPGLRAAQRSLDLFQRLEIDIDRVQVLTTEFFKSGISMDDAAAAIGKKPMMAVPRDLNAACEAMNAGTPLSPRDGALSNAIGELAVKLTGQEAKGGGAPLLKRLFGFGRGANR